MTIDELCRKAAEAVCDSVFRNMHRATAVKDAIASVIAPYIEAKDAEIERLHRVALDGFDSSRVLEWMQSDSRKHATGAFTAGGERAAAYLVEIAEQRQADRIAELERENAELRRDAERLEKAKSLLRTIVCTDGIDAGVIYLSGESPVHWNEELKCGIYDHEFFSPLGDALIALWKTLDSALEQP